MLRNKVLPVEYPIRDPITKFLQRPANNPKRPAIIVGNEIFHILEQEDPRPPGLDNSRHVEKQGTLRLAREPVRPTQSIFLRNARKAEGLAGKSADQNVVVGNVI